MKYCYLILLCLSVLGTYSCKNNSDLKGNCILAGTLYIKNTLDGLPDSNVLANTTLYLQYQYRGISSYLYAATTGADGKFLFSNLVKGQSYWIFTTLDTFGITFNIQQTFVAGQDSIHLTVTPLDSAQNGFILQLQDPLHAPVANFPLFVFNSQSQADYNDSAGSIFKLQTDMSGNFYRFNLAPGIYYVNGGSMVGNILLQGRDSFSIAANKIFKGTFVLDTAQNGFSVLALDSLNTPVANCPLYVFNSILLSDSNLSLGSISTLRTNTYGIAQEFNLQAGTYYINASDTVGKITLGGKDTIVVNSSGITSSKLNLKQN